MGIFALAADERVAEVECTDDTLSVSLMDGRTITVPLTWYPRLLKATSSERRNWQISGGGYGIHWPDVDEDLSTEGLLRGAPAPPPQLINGQVTRKSDPRPTKSTSNTGKSWTSSQVTQLRQLAKQNTPTRVIGRKLGRTENAVRAKAGEKGIPLKPTNRSPYNRRKKR